MTNILLSRTPDRGCTATVNTAAAILVTTSMSGNLRVQMGPNWPIAISTNHRLWIKSGNRPADREPTDTECEYRVWLHRSKERDRVATGVWRGWQDVSDMNGAV